MIRQVPAKPPKTLPNGASAAYTEPAQEPDDADDPPVETDDDEEQEEAQVETKSTPPPRKRGAPKAPPLSTNLKIGDDPMPLKAFLDETTVTDKSSDAIKALAVAVWMKEHRALTEISGSDFYTVCKFLKWTPPVDITSPMRNLKRDDKMGSGAKHGKFVLTLIGENDFAALKKP